MESEFPIKDILTIHDEPLRVGSVFSDWLWDQLLNPGAPTLESADDFADSDVAQAVLDDGTFLVEGPNGIVLGPRGGKMGQYYETIIRQDWELEDEVDWELHLREMVKAFLLMEEDGNTLLDEVDPDERVDFILLLTRGLIERKGDILVSTQESRVFLGSDDDDDDDASGPEAIKTLDEMAEAGEDVTLPDFEEHLKLPAEKMARLDAAKINSGIASGDLLPSDVIDILNDPDTFEESGLLLE